MFKDIKGIIFDMDGTLIDSMWIWKKVDEDFLAGHGFDLPDDLQDAIEGCSFTETAGYFKERFNLDESVEEIKVTWNQMAFDYYNKLIPMKEGVIDFLEHLKNNGIKLGIGTSNSRELVNVILDRFDLHNYFGAVVTSCDVNKGKPSPDVYLQGAKILEVEPENCLVFEDVYMGVMAGLSANMRVCAIADEFSLSDRERIAMKADYFIENYNDCIKLFDRTNLRKEA